MTDTPTPEGDSFWDWSLATYSTPGIAERLLRLQDDYRLDVNLILWSLWATDRFPQLRRKKALSVIRKAEKWTGHVTGELRGIRRWMKGLDLPVDGEAAAGLRNEVKALELKAERICQDMLEKRTRKHAADPEGVSDTPTDYCALYLAHCRDALESPPELGDKSGENGPESLIAEIRATLAEQDT